MLDGPRFRVVGLLRAADAWAVAAGVLVQLALGLLPVAFMFTSSVAVGHVPAAVRGGFGSGAWRSLEGALLWTAAVLVAQQLMSPVWLLVAVRIRIRVDAVLHDRLLDACCGTSGIAAIEGPGGAGAGEVIDGLGWGPMSPGAAAAASLTLLCRYVQWAISLVIISVAFSWLAAVVVAVSGLGLRRAYRVGYRRFLRVYQQVRPLARRRRYLRELSLSTAVAAETRVFGLARWLMFQTTTASEAAGAPIWEAIRRLFIRPFIPAVLIAASASGAVLALAGVAAAHHSLSLVGLTLVIQAVISALAIGSFFDESDAPMEFAARTHLAITDLEREMTSVRSEEAAATTAARAGQSPLERRDGVAPRKLAGCELHLEDVSFTYPGGHRQVLSGLDLVIAPGTSLAIVGFNGAGKTTLMKLLCRFYEPTSGRITAGGTDIRSVPAAEWQAGIAALFQDFAHYELPGSDNIGFGAPALLAEPARVREAARRAGALGFLERLPSGLATPLSRSYEGGTDLSAGQWQRIALARALLALDSGRPLALLDEPTANLDARSEAAFFGRFQDLTKGVTTIVVSHRFATVRRADRIVVLDGGVVTEDGTHQDLVAAGGQYARMFALQAAAFTGLELDGAESGPASADAGPR